MKKTILFSALAFSIMANAQTKQLAVGKNHSTNQIASNFTKSINTTQAIVWSDDFSSAATWTATAVNGTGLWSIGTTGATGSFSIATINSATKANGFAIFDSDFDCSGDEIANLTNVTAINCATHPFVNLKFQQQYKKYVDSTFVFVSNNGSTWTKFTVNENLKGNDFCPSNPDNVTIDISSVAGNQPTVWVRFQFYSPSTLGSGAGCAYSWMIDDVSLIDIPTNDMKLDRAMADFVTGAQGTNIGGVYTMIPKTQILPVTFGAALSNVGSSAQTNVSYNVSISNGSSNVYNQTSTVIATFAYQQKDTLFIDSPTYTAPSAPTATYVMSYSVSQTQSELASELMNNSSQIKFSVNDTVFARDNGVVADNISASYFVGGGEGSELANLYNISTDANASSVSVFIHSSTSDNTAITANIYKMSPNGDKILLNTSNAFPITGVANKNKWITLPLTQFLMKDSMYLASIQQNGISTSTAAVVIGADNVTFQRPLTSWVFLSGATTPTWGFIKELPMIRLNIKAGFVGIEELSIKGFILEQNAPNPFSQNSQVNYQLAKDAHSVLFTVVDVTGRTISSEVVSSSAGNHSVSLLKYAAGVYYYSLVVDGISTTKKMIIE